MSNAVRRCAVILALLAPSALLLASSPGRIAKAGDKMIRAGRVEGCEVMRGGVAQVQRRNRLRNSSFEWDYQIGIRRVMDGMATGWSLWERSGSSSRRPAWSRV